MRDVALLCANCHRLIHEAIANEGRWLGIDEASLLILGRPAACTTGRAAAGTASTIGMPGS